MGVQTMVRSTLRQSARAANVIQHADHGRSRERLPHGADALGVVDHALGLALAQQHHGDASPLNPPNSVTWHNSPQVEEAQPLTTWPAVSCSW